MGEAKTCSERLFYVFRPQGYFLSLGRVRLAVLANGLFIEKASTKKTKLS